MTAVPTISAGVYSGLCFPIPLTTAQACFGRATTSTITTASTVSPVYTNNVAWSSITGSAMVVDSLTVLLNSYTGTFRGSYEVVYTIYVTAAGVVSLFGVLAIIPTLVVVADPGTTFSLTFANAVNGSQPSVTFNVNVPGQACLAEVYAESISAL